MERSPRRRRNSIESSGRPRTGAWHAKSLKRRRGAEPPLSAANRPPQHPRGGGSAGSYRFGRRRGEPRRQACTCHRHPRVRRRRRRPRRRPPSAPPPPRRGFIGIGREPESRIRSRPARRRRPRKLSYHRPRRSSSCCRAARAEPEFEKSYSRSLSSDALTLTTSGSAAGYSRIELLLFPAAATTSTPASVVLCRRGHGRIVGRAAEADVYHRAP